MTLIFDVLVEIPAGSRTKYEVDHHAGRIPNWTARCSPQPSTPPVEIAERDPGRIGERRLQQRQAHALKGDTAPS